MRRELDGTDVFASGDVGAVEFTAVPSSGVLQGPDGLPERSDAARDDPQSTTPEIVSARGEWLAGRKRGGSAGNGSCLSHHHSIVASLAATARPLIEADDSVPWGSLRIRIELPGIDGRHH